MARPTLTFNIAGDRCACGEHLDYCFWCDRHIPACPACGLEAPEHWPICHGQDGECADLGPLGERLYRCRCCGNRDRKQTSDGLCEWCSDEHHGGTVTHKGSTP